MRTTISLDDQLLKEAKVIAASTGRSLTDLVEEALREKLARRQSSSGRSQTVLRTFKGNGLLPGVDLDDSAELLALMDRHGAAP